jgi:hypothetical protein
LLDNLYEQLKEPLFKDEPPRLGPIDADGTPKKTPLLSVEEQDVSKKAKKRAKKAIKEKERLEDTEGRKPAAWRCAIEEIFAGRLLSSVTCSVCGEARSWL